MIEKLTEHDAIEFLHRSLGKEGQLVLPQVRNGTGFTSQTRTADAIVIETWPSRGQSFTGIEYKKSRADWKRELQNPAKADEIGQYCKFWVVLAPKGLIEVGEVPELWGLWEIKGKRLYKTKPPAATEYEEPSVSFVCAMLRSNRAYEPSRFFRQKLECAAEDKVAERHKAEVKRISENLQELRDKVRKFESATGLSIQYGADDSAVVALEIVRHLKNPDQLEKLVERHHRELTAHVGVLEKLRDALVEDRQELK